MDLKKLSRVCDSEANDCTYGQLYNAVAGNLVKDATQKVLCWGGADRPGEYLYVGPTSMLREVFSKGRWEDLAYGFLGGDVEITDEVKDEILSKISGFTEGKPYFIYHYDWNDTGDLMNLECVDADGLTEYCLSTLDRETYWGLMRAYVLDGYPLAEMRLINANDEFPEDQLIANLIPDPAPHAEACYEDWNYYRMHDFDSEITEGREAFSNLDYQDELN